MRRPRWLPALLAAVLGAATLSQGRSRTLAASLSEEMAPPSLNTLPVSRSFGQHVTAPELNSEEGSPEYGSPLSGGDCDFPCQGSRTNQTDKEEFLASEGDHLFAEISENGTKTGRVVTIGFLSWYRMGLKLIAGAVPMAVEEANRSLMPPGVRLDFLVGDSGEPGTSAAVKEMTRLVSKGAVAFVGPETSCAPEALVAAAWNLPMVAYRCHDRKVSDKAIYTTFARTQPPSSKVTKSVIALLVHFRWHQVTLVVANNPLDRQTEEAFTEAAPSHGIKINHVSYLPGDYLSRDSDSIKKTVRDTAERTRIFVLIADHLALVDFARELHDRGLLAKGEYVIVSVDEEEIYDPKRSYIRKVFEVAAWNQSNNPAPFRSVLLVAPAASANQNYQQFQDQVLQYSGRSPFHVPFHADIRVEVPIYAGYAYDAVLLYARALGEVLQENGTERDGQEILKKIVSRSYESILGCSVYIDENGDAEGNYTVLAVPENADGSRPDMEPVGRFTHLSGQDLPLFTLDRPIQWIAGHPPLSEPVCGFTGEFCTSRPDWTYITISSIGVLALLAVVYFASRHYSYERKLACLLWKVDIRDVKLLRTNSDYTLKNLRTNVTLREESRSSRQSVLSDSRTPYRVGVYKGTLVYIKPVYKRSVDLNRSLRKEMIKIRQMRHENITPFIGACVDHPNISILTLFSARGSLEDVLQNEDLDLDTMFVASLVADLIKGMRYLHESVMVSHGNLRSSNCLVDSRWVLQITDFGLHEFRAGQDYPQHVLERKHEGLLWRAPELLRDPNPPPAGSQKGDIYSFAIVLYEIVGRAGPWGPKSLPVSCIIERVMNPHLFGLRQYRPPTDDLSCPSYVINCMKECWQEDPDIRPDFGAINNKLRELQSGLKPNIFDNMIAMMEKYAYNLEGLVQDRTKQLVEEKKKTENLLLRMLPKPVAEQLKRGEPVEAESFDSVTIYFSDIVDFTALSAVSTPLQVVELLNDLYTCFDSIIEDYAVYKVETIGDAYMVVSGLPVPSTCHAAEIANMALRLLAASRSFQNRHRPGEPLKLRIGIHTGPVVAGVVGLKMPRYCLFGDTVNTASRMESTGEAFKIHVSEACHNALRNIGGYILQERGLTPIKGKGEMRTYWLLGRTEPRPEERPDILHGTQACREPFHAIKELPEDPWLSQST